MKSYFIFLLIPFFLIETSCKKENNVINNGENNVNATLLIDKDAVLNVNSSFCNLFDKTFIRFSHSDQSRLFKYTTGQKFEDGIDNYLYFNFIGESELPIPPDRDELTNMIDLNSKKKPLVYPEISIWYDNQYYKSVYINDLNGEIQKLDNNRVEDINYDLDAIPECDQVGESLNISLGYTGYLYSTDFLDSLLVKDAKFNIFIITD